MRKIIVIIMAVALVALPAVAQQQEWQSTSTLRGTGSTYSPQVTAVGAVSAQEMATTTCSSSAAPKNPHIRRVIDTNNEIEDEEGDQGSPIGDAFWPLMLLALAYMSLRVFLKRKRA